MSWNFILPKVYEPCSVRVLALKSDVDICNLPVLFQSSASAGKDPTKKSAKNVKPRDYREWDK